MDRRAAEEYHSALLKRLNQQPPNLDRLLWIPILGVASYYSFGTLAGSIFGGLVGWGICAILSSLDRLKRELWYVEFLRHLHEHTDEAEAGKARFELDALAHKLVKPWWVFW